MINEIMKDHGIGIYVNYESIRNNLKDGRITPLAVLRRQEDHYTSGQYLILQKSLEKALEGGLSPEARANLPRGDTGKTLHRRVARIYSFISQRVVEEKAKEEKKSREAGY
jgi:hypothetical protein